MKSKTKSEKFQDAAVALLKDDWNVAVIGSAKVVRDPEAGTRNLSYWLVVEFTGARKEGGKKVWKGSQ